jgi:hypothetical protein
MIRFIDTKPHRRYNESPFAKFVLPFFLAKSRKKDLARYGDLIHLWICPGNSKTAYGYAL